MTHPSSAIFLVTGADKQIQIKNDGSRLSQEEIERLIREAEEHKAEDDAAVARTAAIQTCERYTFNIRNIANDKRFAKVLDEVRFPHCAL